MIQGGDHDGPQMRHDLNIATKVIWRPPAVKEEIVQSSDYTKIGGSKGVFQTTHWTELYQLQAVDTQERRRKLGELLTMYWKPVFVYLRHKGFSNEDAKDLTQDFFCEIVVGGSLVERAEKSKGRFRTFMLTSLNNYVCRKHHYETAKKRRPEGGLISLDGFDTSIIRDPDRNVSPDKAFNYSWAAEFLRQTYSEVKDICLASGKEMHWRVFERKILTPIMDHKPAPPLKEICAELGLVDERKASNMIGTVKRIFRSTMTRHLRQLVEQESDIYDEFNELTQIFVKA